MKEHFSDPYVQQAQQQGYRSRAVFKLKEIQDKDRLLKPGMTVIDLGAAPGGWSQLAAQLVGRKGRIIALDRLPMDPLDGVEFIQGDFHDLDSYDQLLQRLDGRTVDLVISDMAPNISGIKAADQAGSVYLAELAFDFAKQCLRQGGDLLVKVFQGQGFDPLLKELRRHFATVVSRKPRSSRPRSAEVYLLARNYDL
ncbi:MAG: 23S rRNA (uridine(2552)-2'-O)-methyltransferase RlmE [Candidatus Competibacteraceae bacterium]|nr:23S rRNA (uridine(2552)-2'-O)-methyltransferase RlmE [Candidatus Competibacteraceae bacterium]